MLQSRNDEAQQLEPAVEPSPEDVREELNAICSHKRFARSERLCQFLQFVVEQRLHGNNVNEQVVGINVFGRKAGYDSGSDTIVRTQAVELRRRLEDYYRDNPSARVRISVLRGSYNPTFTWIYQDPGRPDAPDPLSFPDVPELLKSDEVWRESAPEMAEKEPIVPPEPVPALAERHRVALRRRVLIPASLVFVAAIAASILWKIRQTTRLTGNHTIVLAEFVNTTGETMFDGTLKQALAIQLEQSPFFNVLSDAKVAATLKLMGRAANERLTQLVAREICQRTNSQVMIAGSIARFGNPYLIALEAVNCQSGETIASTQAQVPSRGGVLNQLQHAGNQLRRKLGESLASVEQFNKPLEEATTSSLEALKALTEGRRMRRASGDFDAIPYFKRALDLDPNFAETYETLGIIYANSGEISLAQLNLLKAFELQDRATERERFHIRAAYYALVTGELEKAIETYKQWAQTYPRDEAPHINLGAFYLPLGRYEDCVAEMLEAIRINPDNVNDYGNILGCYFAMDRLDEAKAIWDQARARKMDSSLQLGTYLLGFLEGN